MGAEEAASEEDLNEQKWLMAKHQVTEEWVVETASAGMWALTFQAMQRACFRRGWGARASCGASLLSW
jgi:hypothetical protein